MDTQKKPPSSRLATLLTVDETQGELWSVDELASIWTHQLSAPLDGIGVLGTESAATLQKGVHDGKPATRFSDLLSMSHPPLEILRLVKDFAKEHRQRKTLPADIATGLYYLVLGLAPSSQRLHISEMDNSAVKAGLSWLAGQPWLDDFSRTAVESAKNRLP